MCTIDDLRDPVCALWHAVVSEKVLEAIRSTLYANKKTPAEAGARSCHKALVLAAESEQSTACLTVRIRTALALRLSFLCLKIGLLGKLIGRRFLVVMTSS